MRELEGLEWGHPDVPRVEDSQWPILQKGMGSRFVCETTSREDQHLLYKGTWHANGEEDKVGNTITNVYSKW